MSNISGDGGSFSSGNTCGGEVQEQQQQKLFNHFNGSNLVPSSSTTNSNGSTSQQKQPPTEPKKRRSLPGTPDPNAEVIALSPKTLMATNRFVCEVCKKGFQRDQNLQLHRRGHNLPWKLKQRTSAEIRKRVYVCPETSCVHHNPARALGDLTGIKKHFSRKHGEKKWKCEKCLKKYAVKSDWKAHSKTCGTKEYKCDCGTIFSRRDSFITHRAFCDALSEENNKLNQGLGANVEAGNTQSHLPELTSAIPMSNTSITISEFSQPDTKNPIKSLPGHAELMPITPKPLNMVGSMFSSSSDPLFGGPARMIPSPSSYTLQLSANSSLAGSAHMSATALLQKAAQMGATASSNMNSQIMQNSFVTSMANGMPLIDHQSQLASAIGGSFAGQFMPNGRQETSLSQFFDTKESTGMNNMGFLYPGISNQSHGFLENMEGDILHGSHSNAGLGNPKNRTDLMGLSGFIGNNGQDDRTTVDFLGIGGTRPRSFHGEQNQGAEYEGMSTQVIMQGLSPFQQQISNGQITCEKSMWNE